MGGLARAVAAQIDRYFDSEDFRRIKAIGNEDERDRQFRELSSEITDLVLGIEREAEELHGVGTGDVPTA